MRAGNYLLCWESACLLGAMQMSASLIVRTEKATAPLLSLLLRCLLQSGNLDEGPSTRPIQL